MKSLKTTYLIAIVATFLPAWIGGALIEAGNIFDPEDYKTVLGLIFIVVAIFGTSFAFFYLDKIKYGLVSGFGKLTLIVLSIIIFELTETKGHPYIIFLGLAAAMVWGVYDFIILYFRVKFEE